jgi:hypothetical protein
MYLAETDGTDGFEDLEDFLVAEDEYYEKIFPTERASGGDMLE